MDVATLLTQIDDAEAKVEEVRGKLEALATSYITELPPFVAFWFEQEAKDTAVRNSDKTTTLPEATLTAAKKELSELQAKVPSLIEQHLNGSGQWPHREDVISLLNTHDRWNLATRCVGPLREGLGRIYSHLGRLLAAHDLIDFDSDGPWEKKYNSGVTRRYAHPDFPELKPLMQKYGDLLNELYDAANELQTARRKKEEAQAANLWDEA